MQLDSADPTRDEIVQPCGQNTTEKAGNDREDRHRERYPDTERLGHARTTGVRCESAENENEYALNHAHQPVQNRADDPAPEHPNALEFHKASVPPLDDLPFGVKPGDFGVGGCRPRMERGAGVWGVARTIEDIFADGVAWAGDVERFCEAVDEFVRELFADEDRVAG